VGKDIGERRQKPAVSVGEVLAEARHRRGFTVAEVSHYTRIREPVIRGIESDDFLLSGGDSHTRGQIQVLATALGVDPGPLISEFDASHRSAPELTGAEAVRSTIPFRIRRIRRRRRVRWLPVLAVLLLAVVGVAGYFVVSGRGPSSAAAASGRTSPGHPGGTSAPAAAALAGTALVPVRAVAFGPDGTADGDHPQLASRAIDGNPDTDWTTGRYATPRFPNAQRGTGLLLDMGHVVTITGAEVTLGPASGAALQMRTGDTPSLAHLTPVAITTNASGAMGVRLTVPVRARYVLIWFTALPPGGPGAFQASVYNVTVLGVKLSLSGKTPSMASSRTARRRGVLRVMPRYDGPRLVAGPCLLAGSCLPRGSRLFRLRAGAQAARKSARR
jgi:transcriptional regulator with XRE-family HTH domain